MKRLSGLGGALGIGAVTDPFREAVETRCPVCHEVHLDWFNFRGPYQLSDNKVRCGRCDITIDTINGVSFPRQTKQFRTE